MTDSASRWRDESQVSDLFSALADEHCRQVVGYFRSEDTDVATVDELAGHTAAPNDQSTDRKREAVLLHHMTLPKLAGADILEYDPRQQDVRYTGHDGLEPLLDQIRPGESETD